MKIGIRRERARRAEQRGLASLRLSTIVLIATGVVFAAGTASAGNFSVQIGAFRDAPGGFASAASEIGALRTTLTDGGITRYRIGDYDTHAAAEAARTRLVGAGYADAFVVQKRRSASSPRVAAAAPASLRTTSAPRPSGDPLAGVPQELRSQVVLLDGRYHVKEGDRFIRLEQYMREQGYR